ncbi:MAG: hypothetical protein JNK33_00065 [Candidatus Doudnabacteria bacterium]|nr:hypothetical protein [Candidatus Doudnabacteria bacterium]
MNILHQIFKRQYRNLPLILNQASRLFSNRNSILYKTALALSVIVLLLTTVYAAFNTSNYFSTNSDALIATHQFSHGVEGNTVALPGSHANILMIPVLYVQGHLPYRYKSFTFLNIFLVLTTILAWAFLLIKLFGREYEIPIILLLSSLMFASVTFNIGIGNTTFRNIGFPLSLWFIFIIRDLLKSESISRRKVYWGLVGSILFCLLLAGDSFFIYSILVPILAVIVWYWFQSHKFTLGMLRVVALILTVVIGAKIIKWILAYSHSIYFDYAFLNKPTVLPYEHFWPSMQVTFRQLMELQGGSIFGLQIGVNSLLAFINLMILVLGVIGLILILARTNRRYKAKENITEENNFILTTLAVSYFVILAEYVLSGYAVADMGNGQIIDFMNTRYLTLLPLIAIVGFVWALRQYYSQQRYVALLCLVLVVGIITYYPTVSSAYKVQNQIKPVPSKTSINQIIGYLTANKVDTIVTDFWYGPPIRFWSSNRISYTPQINCNKPVPFDSREDWYRPQKGIKTALIIDRGGLNYGYWSCSDQDLVKIYGEPASRTEAAGIRTGDVIKIWIYDYDVRERLQPFPQTK